MNNIIYKRSKELLRDYFFGRRDFDPEFFINDWESKFGLVHDPVPEEVWLRLMTIIPKGNTVCELGAGYGRTAKGLKDSYELILVEPDQNLYMILCHNFPNSKVIYGNCKTAGLIDAGYFFSVRTLEYASIWELIQMFKNLKKRPNILMCWERRYTIRKTRLAAFLTRYKNLYPQNLVN